MDSVRILTAGDSAVLVRFEQAISPEINQRISGLVNMIRDHHIEGIVDLIPSYCALLINYDPRVIRYDVLKTQLSQLLAMDLAGQEKKKRIFEIPVCYGGEYGPDLDRIAEHAGLSREEVIRIHSGTDYLIYMLGFLPGFTYLGGLDERIHTPRLAEPRIRIEAGSVGIGGSQTGIYPLDSPGGWNLMGKTPVKTYDPNRKNPILVEAGDYIRFVPIHSDEYERIAALIERDDYSVVIHQEV